jgi:hypothetical protein
MIKIILSFICISFYTYALTFEVSVSSKRDDAEESLNSGTVKRQSSDLELIFEASLEQKVGIRFQNILLPPNAIITSAYIQFTVDEIDITSTDVIIIGENIDDAQRYHEIDYNITKRPETNASIAWSIPIWDTVGSQGLEQRTPDISTIVQEIISRAGWENENAIAFMFKAGAGCNMSDCQRTAESYNGSITNAPRLYIEYFMPLDANLQLNYRMDECYWFNNSGTPEDVKDSSPNLSHGSTYNTATITNNTGNPALCNYGTFTAKPDMIQVEDATVGNTDKALSVSFWIKADALFPKWANIMTKSKIYKWNNGWGFVNRQEEESNTLGFFINHYNRNFTEVNIDVSEGWVHILGTYDREKIRLYKNGIEVDTQSYTKSIKNAVEPIKLVYDGDTRDGILIGSLDEVKVWDRTLSATDILALYTNESSGNNFDGTARVCPSCETSVIARVWSFLGIPADLRSMPNKSLSDVFNAFTATSYFQGSLPDGWIVYKRNYSTTDNNSNYEIMSYTDDLSFGQGYWLFSNSDVNWSNKGLTPTEYNDCLFEPCVIIDLETTNVNFNAPDYDPNDGSGPNRINMLGFVGEQPVDWADCRILVDGVSYTPTAAGEAGYIDNQIWQYNIGDSTANGNGYTTCNDLSPGGCKLQPYKAFWLILHGMSKNKTMQLLIPKE